MHKPLSIEDIRSCTPFQHHLLSVNRLEKTSTIPNDIFQNQAENVRIICSQVLENSDVKKIKGLTAIPKDIQQNMFNVIAQKEVEKNLSNLRGTQLSVTLDDVPNPNQ